MGFLTGFVIVLCIGNYFRARRAMERQRQRRLARLAGAGNGVVDSPKSLHSTASSNKSDEQQHLLAPQPRRRNADGLLLRVEDSTEVDLLSV